jgi:hypothetical protein
MARGTRPRIEVSVELETRIMLTAKHLGRMSSTVLDRAVMAALDVDDPGWAARLQGKAREEYTFYRHHAKRTPHDKRKATIGVRREIGRRIDEHADEVGTSSGGWLDEFINLCLDKEQTDGVQRHDPQPH